METYKEGNKIWVQHSEDFQDKIEFLEVMVDVFSALTLDRKVWLTDRERIFFVSILLNYYKGIKQHLHIESDEIYNKVFGAHNRKERSIWMGKLQKKKWISYDTDEIKVASFFEYPIFEKSLNVRFYINFDLNNVNNGEDRNFDGPYPTGDGNDK